MMTGIWILSLHLTFNSTISTLEFYNIVHILIPVFKKTTLFDLTSYIG